MEIIKKQLDNLLHHVSLRPNSHGLCKIKEEENILFLHTLFYPCIDDGIEYLLNNNFQEIIEVVNACLKFDDQDFATLFMNFEHRTVFMIITKLTLHLLSNLNSLKVLEYDHLYNIGLLTIKIMHNKHIYDFQKTEFYDIFFRYRFQSNNLTECLLQLIQNITDSLLIQIICLWLDIVVHYQHVVRKQQNDLDHNYFEPRKIISECVIKQIYNLPNDLRLRGSFLFYLTYIPYDHINKNEKLASICYQYILSQIKNLNEWTSDTIHCLMGSVCFITKHFSQHFKYDEEYDESLLFIVSYEHFHKALVSTWTNDETIIIHTIIEYFYTNLDDNNEKMIIILDTTIDKLHKLYENVKDNLIKMNICYLILVSTHEGCHVSDEIILKSFQYIRNQRRITWNGDIEMGEADKFLRALKKVSHYDSIKNAIIRLDKINELVDLINTDFDIIDDSLVLQSKKRVAEKTLQKVPRVTHCIPYKNVKKFCSFIKNKVVLSCSNTELAIQVKRHLEKFHYNILILNQCNNDMEKENLISTCKCMIVCLTDDYSEYQSELILAHKNQVITIPIVIENEKKYCPNEPFLKFILEKYSSSLIRKNINELNDSLADEIKDIQSTRRRTLLNSFKANSSSGIEFSPSIVSDILHKIKHLYTLYFRF
ncbi:unnamed protein product [Adineta steineri]|uniref:TIR domain-containing protein n=1 Tax=Adineta steineri TaxID=433720 RepID=A0A815DP32_9BILA|nr:unnamed protein product [Adineta steineri]